MVSWWQPCWLSSQLVHLLLVHFGSFICYYFCSINLSIFFIISSFIATGIFHATCCTCCMLLCTSRCSSPGRHSSVSKTSPYSSNIFFLESRSPFVFLFGIFMQCMSSFTCSLLTFRVTKFSARLADADFRGSFFVSTRWYCHFVFVWFTSYFIAIMP